MKRKTVITTAPATTIKQQVDNIDISVTDRIP
jgi:hypothetical protein